MYRNSSAISNSGHYNSEIIGSSPFILHPVFANYFTNEEANLFWDEYAKETNNSIGNDIRQEIYQFTEGAPGQTVMLTHYYDTLVNFHGNSIDKDCWCKEVQSRRFWHFVENTLEDGNTARHLLSWFINENYMPCSIIETLMQHGITVQIEYCYRFASPRVKKYILECVIPRRFIEVKKH